MTISRRNFLKLSLLALGGAAGGLTGAPRPARAYALDHPPVDAVGLGRVTVKQINVYEKPDFQSPRTAVLPRDTLVWLLDELPVAEGSYARWHRVYHGYVHSAYLQRVEHHFTNQPVKRLLGERALGQVSMPYTQAMRYTRQYGWEKAYRLYYESNHWVTGIDEGPDGETWYRLLDDLLYITYHAPARDMRIVPASEYAPMPGADDETTRWKKRIEISISRQVLNAYLGDQLVRSTRISSGLPSPDDLPEDELPTDTPLGAFHIQTKLPGRHMGDGNLTSDPNAYELPGVPWVMLFHETGVALHGTYWHNNFGRRMSHGCVNMPNAEALWLFRWTAPVYQPGDLLAQGYGTRVDVVV